MSQKQRKQKHDKLVKTIRKKLIDYNYNMEELATMLHISKSTAYGRLKEPDKFTYKEIQALRYNLKISTEEFLQVI